MTEPARRSHRNNFDLIRLLAAAQVAVVHGVDHLGLRLPFHDAVLAILSCFPGVPIFFLISGFLIASSYDRQGLADFTRNRCLRIFPGLYVCLALSIISVCATGYFSDVHLSLGRVAVWIAAQCTIVQFYNPIFLRGYGVGALNGSLWTIPVELQFYILTPIIALLLRRSKYMFAAIAVFLIGINVINSVALGTTAHKFLSVTFLPWVYMFMLGAGLNYFWEEVRHWFEGKFLWWISIYAAVVVMDAIYGIGAHGNGILPPFAVILSGVVLSTAYTAPNIATFLLRRNDISYGLYIYHMPVYNFALQMHLGWKWTAVAIAFVIASISWIGVERPALLLKSKRPLPKEATEIDQEIYARNRA